MVVLETLTIRTCSRLTFVKRDASLWTSKPHIPSAVATDVGVEELMSHNRVPTFSTPSSAPVHSSDSTSFLVVNTSYDPNLPANKHLPFAQNEDNGPWTERERILATNAEVIDLLEELSPRMEKMYPGGCKSKSRPYVKIPSFPK